LAGANQPENIKNEYIGILYFLALFLKIKKRSKWGIKRKNLLKSRPGWEKTCVFRLFLTPSSHFQ
jgi:hypothetical protein